MNQLRTKIASVIFSRREENFRTALERGGLDEAKSFTDEVISSSEYTAFRTNTGMPFIDFLGSISHFYKTKTDQVASYDLVNHTWDRAIIVDELKCKWPDCNSNYKIQRDHMIPSSLKNARGCEFITDPNKNFLPLCPFHNRMKTNSILIGIAFIVG